MEDFPRQILHGMWIVFALPAVVLTACAELGFRLGLRVHSSNDVARKRTIGGVQAAILGLLGLLLGFTFALAIGRYDARRALVVQDANSIGTTYLRASLLPQEHVAPVQDLLRLWVALRLEYQQMFDDTARFTDGVRKSAELQRQLWEHAVAAGTTAPTPIVTSFITALNDTFDKQTERIAAGRAQIPTGVWLLLLIVAGMGCVTSSYAAGAEGVRSPFSNLVLPILIAIAIALIFDIMHPRQGLIGLSQQPLIDLQQSIAPPR